MDSQNLLTGWHLFSLKDGQLIVEVEEINCPLRLTQEYIVQLLFGSFQRSPGCITQRREKVEELDTVF